MKTILLSFLMIIVPMALVPNMAQAQKASPVMNEDGIPEGFERGKAIFLGRPVYSKEAIGKRISGSVVVRILIDVNGNVKQAKALTGEDLLHVAAEEAALNSKFTPSTLEGKPVMVSAMITFNFSLFDDWEGIGATLSTLAGGVAAKSYGKHQSDLNWQGFEKERDELADLQRDESTDGKSTRAKRVISSIREKLRLWNPTELWYFNLGILTSELSKTAVYKPGEESRFLNHLREMNLLIDSAPTAVSQERVQILREVVRYSGSGNLTVSERKEIVRLLIDNYNKKLTTIQ